MTKQDLNRKGWLTLSGIGKGVLCAFGREFPLISQDRTPKRAPCLFWASQAKAWPWAGWKMWMHWWWKLHCTMQGSPKTIIESKPRRKENPLAPFAVSCSGIYIWSLKVLTHLSLTPGSLAADFRELSRDCPTWGLPSGKAFHMDLRSHPAPNIWQAYWDREIELGLSHFLSCTTLLSSTQLFKSFALTSNQTSFLTLPSTHIHFLKVKRYRVDLEISKISTVSSTSGQPWRAWGKWKKSC